MKAGVAIIICIMIFIAIITILLVYTNKQNEIKECLEPYAKEICLQRNSTYIGNNEFVVRCKEDMRESNSKPYLFIEEELEACSH